MADRAQEKYQLAGVDDRERGFNRTVELDWNDNTCLVTFRYEKVHLRGEAADTTAAALANLVHSLHAKGYSQMRSRLSFRGEEYLGSQEPWIEYPDPVRPAMLECLVGFFRTLMGRRRN